LFASWNMIGPVERAGLKNIIERTVLLQQPAVLEPSELISKMKPVPRSERQDILFRKKTLRSLEEVERMLIQYVPDKFSGNYVKAAKALGFFLSTLKRKLKTLVKKDLRH
jgi:DNA-binding NtrC family response regulator